MRIRTLCLLVILSSILTTIVMPAHSAALDQSKQIERVKRIIDKMNRAVTQRKMPELLSTFASDSIKVDLFPAHKYGDSTPENEHKVKTVKLNERWQSVGPILFSTTQFYNRSVKEMSVQINNGLAVAWLDIQTETLSLKEGAKKRVKRFREVAILRLYGDEWKIVTLTNNRHE